MIEFKDLKVGQLVVAQLSGTNPRTARHPELLEPFTAIVDMADGGDWVGVSPVAAPHIYLHLEDAQEYAGAVLKIIDQQEEDNHD